jgi:hypothetical protein
MIFLVNGALMNLKFGIFLLCVVLVILLLVFVTPGFDGFRRLLKLDVIGRLSVPGIAPQVINVYLEDSPCDEPGGINKPPVNTISNSNRQIRFNATVYDINGDCNGTATFYICANETAVAPNYCDENYDLTFVTVPKPYVQYGGAKNNLYCNYTATYDLPYYRRCGNWYVNVTVFDVGGLSNTTVRWWKDNLNNEVWYPYVDIGGGTVGNLIYMGEVVLDQWNYGGQNTTKNVGNTNITNLHWNATNFTSGIDVIPIVPMDGNTTFAVDDDTNRINGAGYINETPSVQISFPSYGLARCEDFVCTSTRAKYDLWWHIFVPPPPLPSGVYDNVIQYNVTPELCE